MKHSEAQTGDIKMSKTTCPVFNPTVEEFADFRGFMSRIEATLVDDNIGICKVIPPLGT